MYLIVPGVQVHVEFYLKVEMHILWWITKRITV